VSRSALVTHVRLTSAGSFGYRGDDSEQETQGEHGVEGGVHVIHIELSRFDY
jgi:hypothetical protein